MVGSSQVMEHRVVSPDRKNKIAVRARTYKRLVGGFTLISKRSRITILRSQTRRTNFRQQERQMAVMNLRVHLVLVA